MHIVNLQSANSAGVVIVKPEEITITHAPGVGIVAINHILRATKEVLVSGTRYPKGTIFIPKTTLPAQMIVESPAQFDAIVNLASLHNQLTRVIKPRQDSSKLVYLNKSSTYLVKMLNTSDTLLDHCLGSSSCPISAALKPDSGLATEVDSAFTAEEGLLRTVAESISGTAPFIYKQSELETLVNRQLPNVFNEMYAILNNEEHGGPDFVNFIASNGLYFQRFSPLITTAFNLDEEMPKTSDNMNKFPSSTLISKIRTAIKELSKEKIEPVLARALQVTKNLCTWYVLREVIELIAIMMNEPKLNIATKYSTPYKPDIILSICIVCIAKLGTLTTFLKAVHTKGSTLDFLLEDTTSSSTIDFITQYLPRGTKLDETALYRQLLTLVIKKPDLLSTFIQNTAKSSAKITPNPGKESLFLIALCTQDVTNEREKYSLIDAPPPALKGLEYHAGKKRKMPQAEICHLLTCGYVPTLFALPEGVNR